MPTDPAFERNARAFADELSKALSSTITYTPLRCEILEGTNTAFLRFRRPSEGTNLRYVELENSCWISIYQRLAPNEKEPKKVHTVEYSYSYSLSSDPDRDWLVRYDYVPEREGDLKHPYPVSHVHVNANNKTFTEFMEGSLGKKQPLSQIHFPTERISLEDFIEHLMVEFDVPLLHGKTDEEAKEILAAGRKRFADNRTR